MATNQMRREAAKRKLERQQQRRAEQAKKRQRTVVITVVGVVAVVAALIVVLVTLPSGGGTPPAAAAATPTSDPAASSTAAPATTAPPQGAGTPASIPTAAVALPKRPTPFPATVTCAYPADGAASKPNTPPPGTDVSAQGTSTFTLQTTDGAIPMTLDKALAPCNVNSMDSLAKQGYFDNTTCHRLTTAPGLQVLQCGDPTGQGTGGPGYTVPDEVFPELTYGRGLLAMANTGQPNTGGSQFFIIYGDAQLPPQYSVFGSVTPEGLQVVDAIAKRGQDQSLEPSPGGGKPVQPVTISKATVS